MKTIIALSFALISSASFASFASDMSYEAQSAINEATAYSCGYRTVGSDSLNGEYQAAVLEATANLKLFQGCDGCVTMQDDQNAAVLEAVKFW